MKGILIRGDFTKEEFLELMAALRAIDARRPEAHFEAISFDPTASFDEAEAFLRAAVPEQPDRRTTWYRFIRPPAGGV